jgi:hypothetical protein
MVETGDPLAGTERSEASAKNIEMLIQKRSLLSFHIINFHVQWNFSNKPLSYFSRIHYSITARRDLRHSSIPLFQLRSDEELSSE